MNEAPKSIIVLSTLLRNECGTTKDRINRVNQQFRQVAEEMAFEGRKIILVDMQTVNDPRHEDLTDGTHPNDIGYEKMAEIWLDGTKEAARRGYLTDNSVN